MLVSLTPHPDTPPAAAERIEVSITRPRPDCLVLAFSLFGDVDAIALPAPVARARVDDLWKHTCFEGFLRAGEGEAYFEFNLSPSGEWAAYSFTRYRAGMTSPDGVDVREFEQIDRGDRYGLTAVIDLVGLEGLPVGAPWSLGLSAVIEETDGRKSYWALAHAPGKPDFHHRDAFALDLPALEHS